MTQSDLIKAPIKEDIKKFEPFFNQSMESKIPLLRLIVNHVLRRKGKQMRPILVFLTAKLNGEINQTTYTAATLIELLHTATLIHDDVVDNSFQRRGFFSIKALWKSKIAVLVGDYFLAKGLLIAINNNEFQLLKIVSEAVREMAEGELLQLEKARKLDISEETYFKIIQKKTATLIASCAAAGAHSVRVDDSIVDRMKKFGEYLGIAFQIKDDLFDYQKKNLVGKPTGNDLQERKITLPLIYALSQSDVLIRKKILRMVGKKNKKAEEIEHIVNFVAEKGGMKYAEQKMIEYKNQALDVLKDYQPSQSRTALEAFVDYTITRNK